MTINWKDYREYKENPNPRGHHISYKTAQELSIRCNPIKVFDTEFIPSDIKRRVIRNLVDPRNPIDSIVKVSENYNGSNTNFLRYCLSFDHLAKSLKDLYREYNTWEIADILRSNQKAIRDIYGEYGLDVTSRSMRSSKIHLATKPIIEEILGPTITEYYFEGYWFDEFSEEYQMDIEIDGSWCHNPEYDKVGDDYVKSKGIRVLRIEAYTPEDEIRDLIKSSLNL